MVSLVICCLVHLLICCHQLKNTTLQMQSIFVFDMIKNTPHDCLMPLCTKLVKKDVWWEGCWMGMFDNKAARTGWGSQFVIWLFGWPSESSDNSLQVLKQILWGWFKPLRQQHLRSIADWKWPWWVWKGEWKEKTMQWMLVGRVVCDVMQQRQGTVTPLH